MRTLPAALIAVLLLVTAPAGAADFHPGAASAGDPLVAGLGNGGYDVGHYDLDLNYVPATGVLTGTATITATLTEDLSSFDLDFVLPASSVTVDGSPAAYRTEDGDGYGRELVVTPAAGLPTGHVMTVVVRYSARPGSTLIFGSADWYSTPTGITSWGEPDAASQWWYPANAYPSDKATYDVTVTTPAVYQAITNGVLVSRTVTGGRATTHWRSPDPQATYQTVLAIGRYDVTRGTAQGVPAVYAVEQGLGILGDRARADLAHTPEVLAFLASKWGPYPQAAAGGLVVGQPYPSSLETQSRPVYESGLWQNAVDNQWVIVHENSHQWYGDAVTMRRWRDTWLAEGPATYSEWLWSQAHDQGTPQQLFLATYAEHPAGDDLWSDPLNRPSYSPISTPAYQRGAMLLQALRNRIGGDDFRTLMRTWVVRHRGGNATTARFEAMAQTVSGQDLASFFAAWVDGTQRPAPTVANGFPAGSVTGRPPAPASLDAIERADAALAGSGAATAQAPNVEASMTAR